MKIPTYFDSFIPRPRVRADKFRSRQAIKRIIVFVRLPSPTFDYYLAARIGRSGAPAVDVVDIAGGALPSLDPNGAFVIFCRYANRASLDWVKLNANRLAGVGLFIDDDLAAWLTSPGVPIGYRAFLVHNGILPLLRLNRYLDRLWTSTAVLARSIGEERAIVLPPVPRPSDFASDWRQRPPGPVRIVFLAEYHSAEHRFLLPVAAKVLELRPEVKMEVTESQRYASEWCKLPGVTILPFKPWPEFRAYTAANPADIALVPLLPDRINVARSPTKRIDVARMCAAGVFSRSSVFENDATSGEIFLPNDRDAWIDGIVRLIDDPALRARASAATWLAVQRLAAAATEIPGLWLKMV
jgi:hypothetical protein